MAHTFTQIYIQAVFAVAVRQSLIRRDFKEELQKYITGIVRKKGQKLIQINCMPDHTHMLMGLKPNIALSDLMRDVKSDSTDFIKRKKWIRGRFNWQEGFGGFSYIRILSSIRWFDTFRIRRNTMRRKRSRPNTL